jgi:hypothetical protein
MREFREPTTIDEFLAEFGPRRITVEGGGKCLTYDDSSPKITVERGGRCLTYDDSHPTVTYV